MPIATLALTESSADLLFQTQRRCEGSRRLLHERDDNGGFHKRESMWPLAEDKLSVYRENREITLSTLQRELGQYPVLQLDRPRRRFLFSVHLQAWSRRTRRPHRRRHDRTHGQRTRHSSHTDVRLLSRRCTATRPRAGMNQLRLSFCFSESQGDARRADMREAVEAFCAAAKRLVKPS